MEYGFALAVQELGPATSQVAVLGQLAGYRNGDHWFTPDDVALMFIDLRLPTPDVRRALRQLVDTGQAIKAEEERWSLTPLGNQRVAGLFDHLDLVRLEPQLAAAAGADFGRARHSVIPPSMAPVKWVQAIDRLLEHFPFETNVFCMTRFPESTEGDLPDPVRGVIDVSRRALADHGLVLHLAADRQLDDDLWGNVAAHGWACQFGLGLFEDRRGEGLNSNLIIEVGSMLMTGRRCALLRDESVPVMPTDFVGQIYKPVNFDDLAGVSISLHTWCREDLSLGPCGGC